jgi:hypothetical protein
MLWPMNMTGREKSTAAARLGVANEPPTNTSN